MEWFVSKEAITARVSILSSCNSASMQRYHRYVGSIRAMVNDRFGTGLSRDTRMSFPELNCLDLAVQEPNARATPAEAICQSKWNNLTPVRRNTNAEKLYNETEAIAAGTIAVSAPIMAARAISFGSPKSDC